MKDVAAGRNRGISLISRALHDTNSQSIHKYRIAGVIPSSEKQMPPIERFALLFRIAHTPAAIADAHPSAIAVFAMKTSSLESSYAMSILCRTVLLSETGSFAFGEGDGCVCSFIATSVSRCI